MNLTKAGRQSGSFNQFIPESILISDRDCTRRCYFLLRTELPTANQSLVEAATALVHILLGFYISLFLTQGGGKGEKDKTCTRSSPC